MKSLTTLEMLSNSRVYPSGTIMDGDLAESILFRNEIYAGEGYIYTNKLITAPEPHDSQSTHVLIRDSKGSITVTELGVKLIIRH